jgi:hypothetical protein
MLWFSLRREETEEFQHPGVVKKKLPGEIAGENREVHFRRGPFEIN